MVLPRAPGSGMDHGAGSVVGRPRTKDIDLPEGIRRGRTPGTFEVRISVPAHRGRDGVLRRQEWSRTVHGGIREAKTVRAQMVTERKRRWGSRGTLTEHLAWWLDLVEADHSPNTMRNYRAYVRRYIVPALGEVQLKKLTVKQLDNLYADLRARLAPATIRQCHAIIRKSLGVAVRHGDIPANPAAEAQPPKLVRHEIDPPSIDVYQRIYDRANTPKRHRDSDLGLGDFLRVAAGTGARRAEVCGLRWSDIDFAGRTMLIARTIIETDGRLEVHTTKGKKPRRIAIDPILADSLAGHLKASHARARAAGCELAADGYIFSDEFDGSTPWRPDRVSHAFYRIKRELEVDVRLHDLRHLHVTQLLAAGVDVRTVAGRVGHTTPDVTLSVYAHFVPAADRAAADAIGDLLHTRALPQPTS